MKRVIIALSILAIITLLVALTAFLGPNDLSGCEQTPSGTGKCMAADAIVAVSGGDTNARTDAAIERYRDGWAPILIFSGAAQDENGPSNAQAMKTRAVKHGVPADDVLIEEFSRNTAENAANTSAFINERNLTRLILVTSGYHQRRASLEFSARLGPSVQIVNAPVTQDSQWSRWWWVTPRGWWLATSELAKIIAYFFIGGTH